MTKKKPGLAVSSGKPRKPAPGAAKTTREGPQQEAHRRVQEGQRLALANKFAEAEREYRTALAVDPKSFRARIGLSVMVWELYRDAKTACDLLDEAAAIAPKVAQIHQTKSAMLNALGDFEGAVTAARATLEIDPGNALAYINLTDSMKMSGDDPMFPGAIALARDETAKIDDRRLVHFALGKAYQDAGEHDRAFVHFQCGNDLHPEGSNIQEIHRRMNLAIETFSADYVRQMPTASDSSPKMIFILGMPRTGTTLMERIITAHPQASTAGERPELGLSNENFIQQATKAMPDKTPAEATRTFMTAANLQRMQEHYLGKVTPMADDPKAPMIIDKLPHNFWRIGVIKAAFPNSVVIHARRHPMDTLWSCYTQNFKNGLVYTTKQGTLGAYYRAYARLMDHWASVFGDQFIDVDYEAVVHDLEGQARRIIAHCGLPWDDACASPEQAEGPVATASRWQVRQKVYSSSVQKWRRYERQLSPLIEALGGIDWIENRAWTPPDDNSDARS